MFRRGACHAEVRVTGRRQRRQVCRELAPPAAGCGAAAARGGGGKEPARWAPPANGRNGGLGLPPPQRRGPSGNGRPHSERLRMRGRGVALPPSGSCGSCRAGTEAARQGRRPGRRRRAKASSAIFTPKRKLSQMPKNSSVGICFSVSMWNQAQSAA
mmetsp:Transcript_12894/g.35700  ORF Transcript_12894/g.35700 Transcript_12894/m.35700 type:complete len:157 (-) Transcript_12894:2615-3085(-)